MTEVSCNNIQIPRQAYEQATTKKTFTYVHERMVLRVFLKEIKCMIQRVTKNGPSLKLELTLSLSHVICMLAYYKFKKRSL